MKQNKHLFNAFLMASISCLIFIGCNGINDLNAERVAQDDKSSTCSSTNSNANVSECTKTEFKVTLNDAKNLLKSLSNSVYAEIRPIERGRDTLLYLVTTDNGWMAIAGDKRVSPIIAETKNKEESFESMNENLAVWIECYVDELQAALTSCDAGSNAIATKSNSVPAHNDNLLFWQKISPAKSPVIKTKRSEATYKWAVVSYTYCDSETSQDLIPHLIATKWGQGTPWNDKLPIDKSNNNGKCLIGCTAVAIAQILYYTHYSIGKPNALYHNIQISASSIDKKTSNIGFSRSGYTADSDRWEQMSLLIKDSKNKTYSEDLMLDVGNRVNMSYSATGSSANISPSALANYGLVYSSSDYNYKTVKSNLQNSKPVNVIAYRKENGEMKGHSWIIDGLSSITRHFVTEKHFEYTENWMDESEYYDSFDAIRARYNVNSEYDYITEDGGSYTSEYLRMNWGWSGKDDDVFISPGLSDSWIVESYNYKYNKRINYDFR